VCLCVCVCFVCMYVWPTCLCRCCCSLLCAAVTDGRQQAVNSDKQTANSKEQTKAWSHDILPMNRSPVGAASAPADAWDDPDKEDRCVRECECEIALFWQDKIMFYQTLPTLQDVCTCYKHRLQGVLDRLNAEADINLFGFGGLSEEKPAFAHLAQDADDTVCVCLCACVCAYVCVCYVFVRVI
jgi:hypothetical protein